MATPINVQARPGRNVPSRFFHQRRARGPGLTLAFIVVLLLSVLVATGIGPVVVDPPMVGSILLHQIVGGNSSQTIPDAFVTIVWQIRLPRVLLGALVGAGLAIVGVTVQAVVRNPLADPFVLGISSGASVGAVLVIVEGLNLIGVLYSPSLGAFLGALTALIVVFALARADGRFSSLRLLLVGVSVSYVLSGLTSFFLFASKSEALVQEVLFWILGGLGAAKWPDVVLVAVTLVAVLAWLLLRSRWLNVLALGDESARSMGCNPDHFRTELLLATSLLTGVLVASSGAIGFVGFVIPHITRMLIGADHRRLLPAAALLGGIFLVWVDVAARMLLRPTDLPLNILTACVGTPIFVWLVRRRAERVDGGSV